MNSYSEADLYYKLDNMVLGSCQQLRKVFKNRWKHHTGNNWLDDAQCKEKLLEILTPSGSKTKKCSLPAFQQNALKDKSLGEWDMSLLSAIMLLQNPPGDRDSSKKENQAIRNLKNIRNELAHDATGKKPGCSKEDKYSRKCTLEEYKKHTATLKDSLKSLGMDDKDVKTLIERSGVTSSLKALERVKDLHEKAKIYIEHEKFDDAIAIFTDAISTPSLLSEHQGEAYEKRAECYLLSTKSRTQNVNSIEQALLDIKQALEYNSLSWNAHFVAAKCHRQKFNFIEAIHHYEMALAISPVQKHVKQDLYTCRTLAGSQVREDYLNPSQMPINMIERLAHWNEEKCENISAQEMIYLHGEFSGKWIKGQDFVFRGHQYFAGWNVPQSFTEAVSQYAKADKVGNPEGSYNLALCYEHGKGVQQNAEKAVEIYKRVAVMDENTPGIETSTRCNIGVAGAQHCFGLCYEFGIGIEKDFGEAAKWYGKAMSNGVAEAANNLGVLYFEGRGVPLDKKMAEECWKQGVVFGDVNAAGSLAGYYINQMEPEKAKEMFRIGREMGNHLLISASDEELSETLERIRNERKIITPMVEEFEKKNKLDHKGLTLWERSIRAFEKKDVHGAKLVKLKTNLDRNRSLYKIPNMVKPLATMLTELRKRADEGSNLAKRILVTMVASDEIGTLVEKKEELSQDEKSNVLKMLYECVLMEFDFVAIETKLRARPLITLFFEESCEQIGNEDMVARLCHLRTNLWTTLHSMDDTYALEVLKEGVRRYPNNIGFQSLLIRILVWRKMFQDGLEYADKALQIFPDDADLLFGRAIHLHGCSGKERSERVEAYEKFIEFAPKDHTNLPEAYYLISYLYLPQSTDVPIFEVDGDTVNLIESYFKWGEKAENDQLPCYRYEYESGCKSVISAFLGKKRKISTKNLQPKSLGVLQRKKYLRSPVRKTVILRHRKNFQSTNWRIEHSHNSTLDLSTIQPSLQQKVAKNLSTVKPIFLVEMNPTKDKIFHDRMIEFTIVDDPNPHYSSIHLIAEDKNGDCTFLYIYNVDRDKKTLDNFQIGCRIAIINPYMRIGAQCPTSGIRVDEPKCIVYLEGMVNVCQFCVEENADRKCVECKRLYCSRECQKLDWKKMGHKLICNRICSEVIPVRN